MNISKHMPSKQIELTQADKDRIEGRKEFNQWVESAMENPDYFEGFLRGCRQLVKAHTPEKDEPGMTEQAAREFEKKEVSFGQYKGRPWGEVPVDYIVWLTDAASELLRYVKSRQFQQDLKDG